MRINLIRGLDRVALIVIVLATVYGFLSPSSGPIRCVDFVYSFYIQHDVIEVYSLESDSEEATRIHDNLTAAGVGGIAGPEYTLCDGPRGVIACGRAKLEHCLEVWPRTKVQLERAFLSGGDPDGIFVNGRTYCAGIGPDHLYLLPKASRRLDIRLLKAWSCGIVIAIAICVLSRIVALTLICLRWLLTGAVGLTLYCLRWVLRGFIDKEIQKENVNI